MSTNSAQASSTKRLAVETGINVKPRTAKKRASKACECCRERKVRCDVVEHGAPCTNCRLDKIGCIVTESKRKRRKPLSERDNEAMYTLLSSVPFSSEKAWGTSSVSEENTGIAASRVSHDVESDERVPRTLCQSHGRQVLVKREYPNTISSFPKSASPVFGYNAAMLDSQQSFYLSRLPHLQGVHPLPSYIKPLPSRIGPDEAQYLDKKNALSIPEDSLRNEILCSYLEFVHPFMPVLEVHDFIDTIERGHVSAGKVSLLLFQAVMFAGCTFVDMHYLRSAGFTTRREARKAFFQKVRLLYDFDYDIDRVSLVQALLLLTYWYETPDDQKDTCHWMGVIASLAYSIGLHRDPTKSNMDVKMQRLWKRIWWCAYMRDRLVALAMRRPFQVQVEDFDAPMLELEDFDLRALQADMSCISSSCKVARDVGMQRTLANLCIQKAKLCKCISHILSAQYSVVNRNLGIRSEEGVTQTSSMLIPKIQGSEASEVKACHRELEEWLQVAVIGDAAGLESSDIGKMVTGHVPLLLNTALLRLLYFTALSTLHRPQVLSSMPAAWPEVPYVEDVLELSRKSVRLATSEITRIANNLHEQDLIRFLPSTGVTVLLPAIVIHLLDIESLDESRKKASLEGFCQCMKALSLLRDNYPSADHSVAFVDAAVQKGNIEVPPLTLEKLMEMAALTTQPDLSSNGGEGLGVQRNTKENLRRELEAFLASELLASDHQAMDYEPYDRPSTAITYDFDSEFDAFVEIDSTEPSDLP